MLTIIKSFDVPSQFYGTRYSTVVRKFVHGAMGHRIDSS